MILDTTIRTGDKDKDAYIEALEQEIQRFEANNSRKLLRSIDAMAGKISKDLDLISAEQQNDNGTEVELSSKLVDTYLKMVEKCDKIRNFIQVADGLVKGDAPVLTTTTTTTEVTEVIAEEEPRRNFFEETQERVKKGKI